MTETKPSETVQSNPAASGSDVRRPGFPWHALLRPSAWPSLFAMGLFLPMALLPMRALVGPGRLIGRLLSLNRRIREVTFENIERCFSDLKAEDRQALVQETHRELGTSLVESVKTWVRFRPDNPEFDVVDYDNLMQFEAALDQGNGVIILAAHYGSTELNGAFLSRLDRRGRRLVAIYRQPTNRMVDEIIRWGRGKIVDRLITSQNMRAVAEELKAGSILWVAADLRVTEKNAVVSRFMGQPMESSDAIFRIAHLSGSTIIPACHRRNPDGTGYRFTFLDPVWIEKRWPPRRRARRLLRNVEKMISPAPQFYWWCIKRFPDDPAA
ncbi:MAG: hypothetical protein AAGF74_09320 [Pseudomonadota bacterium]